MTAAGGDAITILRARGRRLAKMIAADGTVTGYDLAKTFDLIPHPVADLAAIERLLLRLLDRPDCAIVRGEPIGDTRAVRRLLHPDPETGDGPTLGDVPRRWLALDLDKVPLLDITEVTDLSACAALAVGGLPDGFGQATCIVQATGSHGIKPGARLRLWFWLNRPVMGEELKWWLCGCPVDFSVFSAAQPIYTARPVLAHGVVDPSPLRIVRRAGRAVLEVPVRQTPVSRATTLPSSRVTNNSIQQLLERVLFRLETSLDGERHYRLRAAAFTVGGLLDAADISEAAAKEVLLAAVRRAGGTAVDERNATATIASGLNRGRRKPFAPGGRYVGRH